MNGWELFVTGCFIAILGFFIKKWIDSLERKIGNLCRQMEKKLNREEFQEFVREKDKEHGNIWDRINKHSHTQNGEVVIR